MTWIEKNKKRGWIRNSNLTTFIKQTKHARISFKLSEYIVSYCLHIVAATVTLGVSQAVVDWVRGSSPRDRQSGLPVFPQKNKSENHRNSLGIVILQKDPSILFLFMF
jgi:hypothetical protein